MIKKIKNKALNVISLPVVLIASKASVNTSDADLVAVISNALTKFIFPFGIAVSFGFIIYSGILFIVSSGNPEKIAKAKRSLFWSFLAATIMVLAIPLINMVVSVWSNEVLK